MQSQRHRFQLHDDAHYLNGAYMSPLMKSVEEAGIRGMQRKRNPGDITPDDFFDEADSVRTLFAELINARSEQIAIIPSVSYGLASAIRNLPLDSGDTVLMVADEFPSDYYAVAQWCKAHNKKLNTVAPPDSILQRGETWNHLILESITENVVAVVMSSIHWTDGTIFDLKAIGQRCHEVNARFVVDGTQSVGAMPIDVDDFRIDALICAGYKWLLGPYAIGLAYYGEAFEHGDPIEEAWVNRSNARNFSSLTQYAEDYTPGAGRYNVGEYGNFILIPMVKIALEHILDWKVENIRDYCASLSDPLALSLRNQGFWLEEPGRRAPHLMGIGLPPHMDVDKVIANLKEKKIYVSRRGKSIRVSVHVYNTEIDTRALEDTLTKESM